MSTRPLYGVIHLPPLPGTPFYENGSFPVMLDDILDTARAMADGGLDGALLQTVDRVYSTGDESDPARVAAMTMVTAAVVEAAPSDFAVGVQIMRHAVSASLAVAKVTGAGFIRVDALVGASLSTHGWVEPDPLRIMTYRRALEAFDVDLIADVDSMHYRWAGVGETTGRVAERALSVGADAVCVAHPDPRETLARVADVRHRAPQARVVLGGFVDHDNAATLLAAVDGAFVSGCLADPTDRSRVDPDRVRRLVAIVRGVV